MSRMRGADKDQFIKEHVDSVAKFTFKQSMRHHELSLKRSLQFEQSMRKRQLQDEFDHKMKYFKLHRWALIRHVREEKTKEALVRLEIKNRVRNWIQQAMTFEYIKEIHRKY